MKKQYFTIILLLVVFLLVFMIWRELAPPFLVSNNTGDGNQEATLTAAQEDYHAINVSSQNPAINILKVDNSYFQKKLIEQSFWDFNRVLLYKNSTASFAPVTVRSLDVTFVSTEEPLFKANSLIEDNLVTYESAGMQYDEESQKLTISIYLSNEVTTGLSPEKLSERVSVALLRVVFYITTQQAQLDQPYDSRYAGLDTFILTDRQSFITTL
ncbi:hypothetical protein KA012_04395 [Candidatus Woesebacteria bacterium]|nr:hypothetical protein [Candidatus Woesebacteria bacterium]